MDDQIPFQLIQTLSLLASDPRSPNAIFVPINHETPPLSMAYLKDTADPMPRGERYCFTFDYAMTDLNIAWLSVLHRRYSQPNDQGQFFDQQIWTNTAEIDTGRWQTGQILIDGESDWTVSLTENYC